jgi:uncharacterized protein YcbX
LQVEESSGPRYEEIPIGEIQSGFSVLVSDNGNCPCITEAESLRQRIAAAHGADVSLIRVNNGIFDDAPISVITTATIREIEKRSGCGLDIRRFRPNLLVEPTDDGAMPEDAWLDKTLQFGDHPRSPAIRVTARDVRCVMVNFDPETAAVENRVFSTIARSYGNCAGVYASTMKIGTLSVGDRLYLSEG